MTTSYRIFDNATGEEIYPSDAFEFAEMPVVGHTLDDPDLASRFGCTPVVRRLEEPPKNAGADDRMHVFVDACPEGSETTSTSTNDSVTGRGVSVNGADEGFGGGIEGSGRAPADGGMLTEG